MNFRVHCLICDELIKLNKQFRYKTIRRINMDKETIKKPLIKSADIRVNCLICDELIRPTDCEVYLMSHGISVVCVYVINVRKQ